VLEATSNQCEYAVYVKALIERQRGERQRSQFLSGLQGFMLMIFNTQATAARQCWLLLLRNRPPLASAPDDEAPLFAPSTLPNAPRPHPGIVASLPAGHCAQSPQCVKPEAGAHAFICLSAYPQSPGQPFNHLHFFDRRPPNHPLPLARRLDGRWRCWASTGRPLTCMMRRRSWLATTGSCGTAKGWQSCRPRADRTRAFSS